MTTHSAWVIAGIVVFAVVFSILLALNKAPSPHPVWVLPTGVLIIVAALSWAGQWEFKHSLTLLLVLTFVVVAIAATYGVWHRRNSASDPEHPTILEPVTHFEDTVTPGSNERATLFVLIHGFLPTKQGWRDVRDSLRTEGDVIALNYEAGALADTNPDLLAERMAKKIDQLYSTHRYLHIVLIGHSVGSLMARKTYLFAANAHEQQAGSQPWVDVTKRIVLLAGMNRGWDVSGRKPLDMSPGKKFIYLASSVIGRLIDRGSFILGAETGAPFVSNLRIDWMSWVRAHEATAPIVVQLLGDIDDVVSDEDNKDLRATASARYFYLRVRGTGHNDIVQFREGRAADARATLGTYRKEKFLLAATGTEPEIRAQDEEQRFESDTSVTQIVFVLHGIRDLGEWSSEFETELLQSAPPPDGGRRRIVSVRYGYFSMASFVFRPDRQKFVRWFMDQYTETLAKYPNATTIDFIGHSNGTYLLATALKDYRSLKVRRIVFAGSVVQPGYDWATRFKYGQVQAVRNYVATEDAVVGFFPRFFDTWLTRKLGNDVGAAGTKGFQARPSLWVQDVTIPGGHSAFRNYIGPIVRFVTVDDIGARGPSVVPVPRNSFKAWFIQSGGGYLFVWALLVTVVVFPGIRVAIAAGQYAWYALFFYVALVVSILKRA